MMKKLFFILSVLLVAETYAQSDKNYMLETRLGYNYSHKDKLDAGNGFVPSGSFGEINNDFSFAFSAGRKLKSNFYYGLGFSYQTLKQVVNPDGDVTDPDDSSGYGSQYVLSYKSVTLNQSYAPVIFFKYYYNLSDRFSINFDLYSRYEFNIATSEANFQNINILPSDSTYIVEDHNSYKESKKQFLSFGISPSFRINIIKNLGLECVFGSIEYRHKLKDSRAPDNMKYSSEFTFAFKPENWLIGFYLKI